MTLGIKPDRMLAQGGRCLLNVEQVELVNSLIGHTIIGVEWRDDCSPGGSDWTGHEYARPTLDDGRLILVEGYGYDAWGATIREASDPR